MDSYPRRVVVTGVGPVTSIGTGCDDLWASLDAGRSNVQTRMLPSDVACGAELPIAAMPAVEDVPGLARHVDFLTGQDCAPYRELAYALLAIELALDDAGLDPGDNGKRVGAVQVFEAPGVEGTVSHLFRLMSMPPPPGAPPKLYDHLASYFYSMQPFHFVHLMGKAFGLHGFSTSVHNACSSGLFAMEIAAQQIRAGNADAMIVVGGEAFETAVRLEWFRRLEMYASDTCMRPFDAESCGFYVGEGAGAIVLEAEELAARRGAKPYAAYLGGAHAQQAWKQTIPDVRALRLRDVITEALTRASVSPADLDLIVPHGAGTMLCDGYEASCLAGALGDAQTSAVATVFKPNLGHMLAASGITETICALLAMKHGRVPATLGSRADRVKLAVPLVTESVTHPIRLILKMSTGFTGHDAAGVLGEV